jgi:hypothetical protein
VHGCPRGGGPCRIGLSSADQAADRVQLDPGYYTTLLGHAAVLSTAEVKALLARELDPGMEVVVLLGERTAVMTAFSDAGLVDVELVEAKGK